MTAFDEAAGVPLSDAEPAEPVPFEAIPQLAANEAFISKAARLRELKELKDKHFEEGGEFDQLRTECGAMALAAGVKSVTYFDLRITNSDGGFTKPELSGVAVVDAAERLKLPLKEADLRAIALAAVKLDIEKLLSMRIPATLIEAARALLGKGTKRSASVSVGWAGRTSTAGTASSTRRGGGLIQ